MSAADLKSWMDRTGKTVIDIASTLKIAPNTVQRFLRGEPVHRGTRARLEELVKGSLAAQAGAGKSVTG